MDLPSLVEITLIVLSSAILYRLSQLTSLSLDAVHKSRPVNLLHSSDSIARKAKEAPSTCHAPVPSPKCFRISNISSDWNAGDLLKWTQNQDPSWRSDECRISLYPSYHGTGQTALLDTKHRHASFADIDHGKAKTFRAIGEASDEECILSVDYDFYNLTPLNEPMGYIVAELAYLCDNLPDPPLTISMQCCCRNWSGWSCIWIMEKSRQPENVVERLSPTRYSKYPYHDLWL
jgi:hypothetical protein